MYLKFVNLNKASTFLINFFVVALPRFITILLLGNPTGWKGRKSGPNYIVVDLVEPHLVTKLSIQNVEKPCWYCDIVSCKVSYSADGILWNWAMDKHKRATTFSFKTGSNLVIPHGIQVPFKVRQLFYRFKIHVHTLRKLIKADTFSWIM